MVIGFILGVVGVIFGLAGAAFGLLFSLLGGAIIAVLMVMLLIGAMFLSPVFAWVMIGLVAACIIRGLQWLERSLRA